MYLLKLTDNTGVIYAKTETTHVDFRKLNDTKGGELDQIVSSLIAEGIDTDDVFDVDYVGFAAVKDHRTTLVFSLVQVDEETGEEEHAGFVTARNMTAEHQEAFFALQEAASKEDATAEALYPLIEELAQARMYLCNCGGNVEDFKEEVDEAIGSSDWEFVWAGYDYEVRRLAEAAAA